MPVNKLPQTNENSTITRFESRGLEAGTMHGEATGLPKIGSAVATADEAISIGLPAGAEGRRYAQADTRGKQGQPFLYLGRWQRGRSTQCPIKEYYVSDEIEWWDYDDVEEMAAAVAGDIGFIIESAIEARGAAVIALAGGKTPIPIYKKLSSARLDWKRVTMVPADERIVPLGDPLSNVTALAKYFLPKGARVIPIVPNAIADYKAAGRSADALMQDLHWPLDLCLLGVGSDGHAASIFPGPDFDEAVNGPKDRRALGVMPDPLPIDAPMPRVSLSLAAITAARALMIAVTGQEKRAVIETAIKQGPSSAYPVGRALAATELPVDIHWAPAG